MTRQPPPRPSPWQRHPWLADAAIFLVGLVAFLPAVATPLMLDDYVHSAMVHGTYPVSRNPFDLYNFVGNGDRTLLMARGLVPWWSHPQLTIRFFRPLTSGLLWLDYRLFRAPLVPHLHSLFWWAAAVLAARALYRRLFDRRTAWLATAIFAVAPCHAMPLAWLANREALVSLAFGALGLSAYLRWREAASLRSAALAAAFFAVALLGGEYALCFGGYVLAIELVRRDGLLRRAAGVLPFLLPAVAYLAVRAALHCGTVGSGFYRDPLHDPMLYLSTAPRRLATLLLDTWLDEVYVPGALWALLGLAVVLVVLLWVPIRRTFAGLDASRRQAGKWLLLGSSLALLPLLAVLPSARLVGVGVLGVAPLVALVLERAWFPAKEEPRRGAAEWTGIVAVLLGFAHLVEAPVTSFVAAWDIRHDAVQFADHARWLQHRVADPEKVDVILPRATWLTVLYGALVMNPGGKPPAHWRVLALTGHVLAIRRDAHTLDVIAAKHHEVFPEGRDDLFRSDDAPLRVGDQVTLPGMRATILRSSQGRPPAVRFTFDRDLDDPSMLWVVESESGYHDAPPPAPGFGEPFNP